MGNSPRAAAVLLAVAVGCGGSHAPSRTPDEQAVSRTVTSWLGALATEDSPRACSYLTRHLQTLIDQQLRTHSEPGSCRTWAGRWIGGQTPPGRRDAHVTTVHVAGRRATATIDASSAVERTVELRKVGGRWLIENY